MPALLSHEAKIIGHPTRLAIMLLLEFEHSPKELAELLDKPLGMVSYHVRDLAGVGVIEESRQEPRRGALEHFYRRSEAGEASIKRIRKLIDIPPRKKLNQEEREAQLLAFLAA